MLTRHGIIFLRCNDVMKLKFKHIKLIFYTYNLVIQNCKKQFFKMLILSIISETFTILLLFVTQNIFNDLQEMIKPFNQIFQLIIIYILFTIFITLIKSWYSYESNQLNIILGYRINYMIMKKCSNLSLKMLETSETYNMLTRLTNEAIYKPYQSVTAMITIFINLISLIPISIIIFTWNIWIFVLLLISSFISFRYNLKIATDEFNVKKERSNNERKAWYYTYLLTHDVAFKEVQVLKLKDYFLHKYQDVVKIFISQESKINKIKILFSLVISILQDIVLLLIIFLSIREVYNHRLLIGTAMMYINVITLFQSTIIEMSSNIYSIYNGNLFIELLKEFFNYKESNQNGKINIRNIDSIKIKNLYFQYNDAKKTLTNVILEIKKGEIVAILGRNGSGKSTLLKLLCSLYEPDYGQIKINNIDLNKINKESYRQQISVLFQDFLKFEGTLSENIYIGNIGQKMNINAICSALKLANVNFCIQDNQYKLDIPLGAWFDGGTQLSGGQWQKIALARVYYKKASLYLLDEPSSSLDIESEAKVFDSFFHKSINAIGIYITHRTKIAQKAHKIIVINDGKIIDIGTHDYLFKNCKLYKDLYIKEQNNI